MSEENCYRDQNHDLCQAINTVIPAVKLGILTFGLDSLLEPT